MYSSCAAVCCGGAHVVAVYETRAVCFGSAAIKTTIKKAAKTCQRRCVVCHLRGGGQRASAVINKSEIKIRRRRKRFVRYNARSSYLNLFSEKRTPMK